MCACPSRRAALTSSAGALLAAVLPLARAADASTALGWPSRTLKQAVPAKLAGSRHHRRRSGTARAGGCL